MGYPKICQHIKERLSIDLGQTTPDGNFTFLPIVCLGDCDHAPVLMIDDDYYHDLDEEKVDRILASYEKEA
jgi:NADH-quinone oxidoreductase subunit E